MPLEEYAWLPRSSILTFEETERLVGVFVRLGVHKVRLTGGEPLLRRDIEELIRQIAAVPGIRDLALTTNGVLLARHVDGLREAGLGRITVSLDTLRPERFENFARSARHEDVVEGIQAARAAGFRRLKINTVVIRDYNDDELTELIEFARAQDAEVRLIEYMDVGGATDWSSEQVVGRDEILAVLARRYGAVSPLPTDDPTAPAERFVLPDGLTFGVIASTTAPFCRTCDRARLTADGLWFLCLYAADGIDLRAMLRDGVSDDEIATAIAARWERRADRGAEDRATVANRGALYSIESLRHDPHREMHTRGG
jgi:cyclic pyranopterin phosphate synthase